MVRIDTWHTYELSDGRFMAASDCGFEPDGRFETREACDEYVAYANMSEIFKA